MTSKKDLMKDLKFCKELMDRLVNYAEESYTGGWNGKHTVIQTDIIRLRRELNTIREKLEWSWKGTE